MTNLNENEVNLRLAASQIAYEGLLQLQQWKDFRQLVLCRDRFQCKNCGKKENLHVHHRQYHRDKASRLRYLPWEYNIQLLITLCEECHDNGHHHYKVKTIFI